MKQIYQPGFQTFTCDQSVRKKFRFKRLVLLKLLFILTGLTFSFLTQAQTVDEIIEKHLAQTGGRAGWEAVKSFRKVTLNKGHDITTTLSVKAPNKQKTVEQIGALETIKAFDGQTAWRDAEKKPEKVPAWDATYKELDPFANLNPFLNNRERGTLTLLGKTVADGINCYQLRFTPKPAPFVIGAASSIDYFISTTDFKLVKSRTAINFSPQKVAFINQEVFSDFKTADGLSFPFTIKSSLIGVEGVDSTKISLTTVTSLEINSEIDDSEFTFPDDVVVTKAKPAVSAPASKSGMDRKTADLITASLNWQPIQKPGKTYDLKWASEPGLVFKNVECPGNLVYSGAIDGSVIQGQCRIYYPNGYFEGIIEPLDLKTLVLGASATGSTLYQRHIPADRVQVISGKFFNCANEFLTKIGKCNLASAQPYFTGSSKIVLNLYEDLATRVSWQQNYRNLMQQAGGGNDMIVDPVEKLADGMIKLNYKASKESAKTRWLEKLNDLLSDPDLVLNTNGQKVWSPIEASKSPYEIVDDNGHTFVLAPQSKRAEFQAYKAGIEEDYQLAQQQLARQKANVSIAKKQRDDAITRLGITVEEFTAFTDRMVGRANALAYLQVNRDDLSFSIPELKFVNRTSTKGFPYYGNVSLKLIDASDREVGSYDYVYDHKPATDVASYYNASSRELKANVTNTESINRYDVYCDGQKFSSVKYVRTRQSASYEGSFGGTLFETIAGGLYDRAKVGGFEKQLLLEAQLQGCYYQGNAETKTKPQAQAWFEKAQDSVKNKKYADAIEQLDAAIYADENPAYYQLRADLFDRSNQIGNAFQDYLWLIQNANPAPAVKGELYRKMAYTLAKIPFAMRMGTYELYADYAPIYLKKAAMLGDAQAKTVLTKAKTSEDQLQLLRTTN